MKLGLGPGHIVLDKDPAPSTHVYCGQTAGWIKMSLGMEVCGLGRGIPQPSPYCVRWGPSSPQKREYSPQFSAHVCCGQTAEWI